MLESSCKVSIFDPYLLPDSDNNFINSPFESDQKYDAIIVAVAHNEFLNYTIADFNQLTKGKLVLLDLKGIYEKSTWKL